MKNKIIIVNTVDARTPSVCRVQGEIFCEANNAYYDIEDFVNKYLASSFCAQCMDTFYSVYQIWWPEESIFELVQEVDVKKVKDKLACDDVLFWMGYTYRLLYYLYGIYSAEMVDRIPFHVMMEYYYSLHTMSYEQACEEILIYDFPEWTDGDIDEKTC